MAMKNYLLKAILILILFGTILGAQSTTQTPQSKLLNRTATICAIAYKSPVLFGDTKKDSKYSFAVSSTAFVIFKDSEERVPALYFTSNICTYKDYKKSQGIK